MKYLIFADNMQVFAWKEVSDVYYKWLNISTLYGVDTTAGKENLCGNLIRSESSDGCGWWLLCFIISIGNTPFTVQLIKYCDGQEDALYAKRTLNYLILICILKRRKEVIRRHFQKLKGSGSNFPAHERNYIFFCPRLK